MKQTPHEFYSARHEASLNTALALEQAAIGRLTVDRRNINSLADRIRLCGSKANVWKCNEAINYATGELFFATGQYWRCGSKFCSNCLSIKAKENRNKLRNALKREQLKRGERLNFITFTIPNVGLPLLEAREVVNRAWCLMRKRLTFASLFRGGGKSEEFTLRAAGYHYHLHLLTIGRWFLFVELRSMWTECAQKAFEEAGIPFDVKTSDGLLMVKVVRVTDLERAIQEVCKYITKSDSWSKLRKEDLAEVALIPRWHRMFELFGCLNNRGTNRSSADEATTDSDTIVHTSSIIDGEADALPNDWRTFSAFHTRDAYRLRLAEEFERARKHRVRELSLKYNDASVVDLFPSLGPLTPVELADWLRDIVCLPVAE